MLKLKLKTFTHISGPHHRYTGDIRNIRGGRRADYFVVLYDGEGHAIGKTELVDYPRWAEPVAGIVARCLYAALRERRDGEVRDVAGKYISLEVYLNRTLLREVGGVLNDAGSLFSLETPPSTSAWQLMAWQLADDAFGGIELPPVPPTVEPPIYDCDGVKYCRSADLPHEAREAFERWMFGQSQPGVFGADGERLMDVCHPWDMDRFLWPL